MWKSFQWDQQAQKQITSISVFREYLHLMTSVKMKQIVHFRYFQWCNQYNNAPYWETWLVWLTFGHLKHDRSEGPTNAGLLNMQNCTLLLNCIAIQDKLLLFKVNWYLTGSFNHKINKSGWLLSVLKNTHEVLHPFLWSFTRQKEYWMHYSSIDLW